MKKRKNDLSSRDKRIVVGIIRVSTTDQGRVQHGSLETQKSQIERWCKLHQEKTGNCIKVDRWIEEEKSAFREKNYQRSGMMQLLDDIAQGKVRAVVFESLSRLSRSVKFSSEILYLAEQNNVEVWETSGDTNYTATGNAVNSQLYYFKAATSEVESRITSLRVSSKQKEAMVNRGKDPSPRGSFLGLDLHPNKYGFYVVNEKEMSQVREIMDFFVRSKSYHETVDFCNSRGFRTKIYYTKQKADKEGNITHPEKRGGEPFDQASLKSMFENVRYFGFRKFKDVSNQFPNLQDEDQFVEWSYAHGSPINKSLWDQVQEAIKIAGFTKRPRKSRTSDLSYLSGLLIDSSGNRYHCQSAKDHGYRYYFNPHNNHRVCMDDFDRQFLELIEGYIDDQSALDSILKNYINRITEELKAITNRMEQIACSVNKASFEIEQLYERRKEVLLSVKPSEMLLKNYGDQIKTTEHEVLDLMDELTILESKKEIALKKSNNDLLRSSFSKVINEIKRSKKLERKHLIKFFVKRLVVNLENHVELVFNSDYLVSLEKAEPGGQKVAGSKKWWRTPHSGRTPCDC